MSIEENKNRDLFFKFCFMYFLAHILKILEIDEEIEDNLPTETLTFKKAKRPKIFDNFLDFQVITKSGKILIFEFKKNTLRRDDLKQAYNYYQRVYCKNKKDLQLIMITISKKGKIREYTHFDLTFHPRIIQTKKINKQKDLNCILDKFENNKKLTPLESSLLIAPPLFEIDVSESELIETICENIKNKPNCIAKEMLDKITLATYLNIIEYVDIKKQDELLEMINMEEKCEGVIAQLKKESEKEGIEKGMEKGKVKGEKGILEALTETFTIDAIAKFTHKEKSEILEILNS